MNGRLFSPDRRRFLTLGAAMGMALACPAIVRAHDPVSRIDGAAFGTGWQVTLPAGTAAPGLRARLETLLQDLDAAFSPWRADSVIARFNAGKAREMAVADDVARVVAAACAIAGASGGCFDPTVGPLVARWGFGPIRDGGVVPDGWRHIAAGTGQIARADAGQPLDLCGIAKGQALDSMTAMLLAEGHDDFLVDLGGELAARGRHPAGHVWRVGVEDPRSGAPGLAAVLHLDGLAVATSGDRTNGYDIGSRRYSHIIDPATREPAESGLASVSVVMPDGRDADGWATALMAAGETGPELARGHAIAALFLFRDGAGLRRVATGSMVTYLAGGA